LPGGAPHRAREAVFDIRVGERCDEFNCVVAGLDRNFATGGRATNAASPRSATRPRRIIGDSRSPIGWNSGCAHVRTISAKTGGSIASASLRSAAITSARIK